jgi:hypothetical protein
MRPQQKLIMIKYQRQLGLKVESLHGMHCTAHFIRIISFNPHFKTLQGQALVAHTCNPKYLGGRDQEDQSLKTVGANG